MLSVQNQPDGVMMQKSANKRPQKQTLKQTRTTTRTIAKRGAAAPGMSGASTSAARTMRKPSSKSAQGAAALSKQRIVAAALEQIDRNGVMGFSLRDVARSLGVYPAAIYWHVATRDDLLASVVECVMADVAPEPDALPWQDWLRELFGRCRAVVQAHPNIGMLLGGHLVANASLNPRMVDRILAVLVAAGCTDEHIVLRYNAVIAAMVGFATLEFAGLPTDDPQGWTAQLQQRAHEIRALEYPTLARYLPQMANRAFIVRWQNGVDAPMQASFDTYVELFITGLEQALAADKQ